MFSSCICNPEDGIAQAPALGLEHSLTRWLTDKLALAIGWCLLCYFPVGIPTVVPKLPLCMWWLSFRVGLRETLIEVKTTLLTWACKAQNILSFTSCWPSKRHKAGLFQRPSTQWVSWEWVLQLSVAFECLWCLLTSDLEPQMGSPGQGTKSSHKCTSHKTVR